MNFSWVEDYSCHCTGYGHDYTVLWIQNIREQLSIFYKQMMRPRKFPHDFGVHDSTR